MMKKFLNWFNDRTGYRGIVHDALFESIPGGARWRYVWGSTLVFTFFVQVVTGMFLWTAYAPSAQTAWESVYYIQNQMTLGWLVRGIHHFSAQAMVVLLALHLLQVIIDGAYRAPREINFWLGVILMTIVLGLSLTGYLLPWDQKGYYATKVATNIMGVAPGVGTEMQEVVQGGNEYGHHTLTRFFALHAGILPASLVVFLFMHVAIFRRHGIHAKDPNYKPDAMFWPDQVLKDAVACLAVLATVLLLAVFKGAELHAPADPSTPFDAARPEWYFLFLFRFLKFEVVEEYGLTFGAIVVPGLLMLYLILMPIIGHSRVGHKINVTVTMLLAIAIGGLTGLAIYEDWYSDAPASVKFREDVAEAHKLAKRAKVLAESPSGIPPTGAVTLLRNDPLTQGPKIFAKRCASCHRYKGHDGTGEKVMVNGEKAEPTATDLGSFGSRRWVKNVLLDYHNVFAPLENTTKDGENLGELYLAGDMATWSEDNRETLQMPENEESLDALIEFLVAQSEREDLTPFDDELVAKGRKIFEDSTAIAKGELSLACVDCHAIQPVGEMEVLGEIGSAPSLTGYGGREWLKGFISNPEAEEYYGYLFNNNAMPAFEQTLPERDLDLLVRWMIHDYYMPERDPTAPEEPPVEKAPEADLGEAGELGDLEGFFEPEPKPEAKPESDDDSQN